MSALSASSRRCWTRSRTGCRTAPGPGPVHGITAVSAAAAKRLRSAVDFAWDLVAGNPAAADQPLVTGSTARLLAAAGPEHLPEHRHGRADPGRPPRRPPRHAEPGHRVHRGARRADLTRRTSPRPRTSASAPLQAGLPPGARRHAAGLPAPGPAGAAHRDLLAGGPAGPTVTAVSVRWGFSSPSRFAAYYRDAFGVPPSYTRSRPAEHPLAGWRRRAVSRPGAGSSAMYLRRRPAG